MNTLGSLLICGLQVTLVAAVGGLTSLLLRRWLRTSAAVPLSATLVAVVLLTACAFSSWPSWLHEPSEPVAQISAAPSDGAPLPGDASVIKKPTAEPFGWREMAAAAWKEVTSGDKSPTTAPVSNPQPVTVPRWSWLQIFGAVFAIGVLVGLVRLIGGLWSVRVVVHNSRPLKNPELLELVDLLRAEMGCVASVEVRECPHLATAATVGWRKPVVLISSNWRLWDETQLRSVVAHEIAHIARGDFAAGLVAQLGVVLHFYHPLVHWLERRLRLEQELAADALAASVVGGSRTYLQAIGELALTQSSEPLGWPAQSFLPTRRTFLRRIEMLRNLKLRTEKAPTALRFGTLAAIAAVTLLAVGLRPPAGATGTGPGIVAAAQPAAETALKKVPALTPMYVPANALLVGSVRPSDLIKFYKKAVEVSLAKAGEKLRFPISPDPTQMFAGCEQITMVGCPWMQGAQRRPEPADIGFCLVFSSSQTRDNALKQFSPGLAMWQRKTFATFQYETIASMARYLPDDKTLVIGSESAVQTMMLVGAKSLSPLTQSASWKQAATGSGVIALDTALIRETIGHAPPNPVLGLFAPLWDSATNHTLGIKLDDKLSLTLDAQAADEPSAEKVKTTLVASMAMLTNMAGNLAKSPDQDLAKIATDSLIPNLEKHELQAKGKLVSLRIEGDVAPMISPLVGQMLKAQSAALNSVQKNNLKQIMLALHNYHDVYKRFPASAVVNPKTGMKMSWRVAILPFIDQAPLYNQYKQDEPWDSEANKKILAKMPAVFRHTSQPQDATTTSVVAAFGKGLVFDKDDKEGTKIQNIADGTSNTIAVLETKTEIPWTKPDDLEIDVTAEKLPELGFGEPTGFLVGFGDGSVRYIKHMVKPEVLKALLTRKGGEPINSDDF